MAPITSPKLLAALAESHKKIKKDQTGIVKDRQLAKHNSEAEALELGRKKIPEASDTQLRLVEAGGKSMHAEIIEARREAKLRNGRISCSFWRALKTKYSIEEVTSTLTLTTAEKETMAISPVLVAAIKTFKNKNTAKQSKEALSSFLRSTASLNKRELHGLVKLMSRVRCSTEKMRDLWMSFMQCAVRMGWHQSDVFLTELGLLHDSMDEVLVDLWTSYRAEDWICVIDCCRSMSVLFVIFVCERLLMIYLCVCSCGRQTEQQHTQQSHHRS